MFVCFFLVLFAAFCRFSTTGQMITGKPLDVPVNSTKVLNAARFALVEFNRANTEEHFDYKIVNITSAKIQVVAGINLILDVHLGRTVCKIDMFPCVYDSQPKDLQCHFIVTEVPWKALRTLAHKKCHLHTN
ncbi:cystatin-SA-like [Notolabrus celidotus]|uniref:cystatin-SA-like n=1 Tax=Notolabrus celidotus TaxID=1203425 RepID=UPI00148F5375|nr:cystatin-SA-like [Notolabrus celidotus]